MSPSKPPTAKATITEREEGSMFGGHKARRKSDSLVFNIQLPSGNLASAY